MASFLPTMADEIYPAEHKKQTVVVGGGVSFFEQYITYITLVETNTSHLKIDRNPKGKDRIPTIHFQVLLLLVSGRVILRPKRMICPRPFGMTSRKTKTRGRREEFGQSNIDVIFMCATSVHDRGPSETRKPKL